jgi:hypothetical protein
VVGIAVSINSLLVLEGVGLEEAWATYYLTFRGGLGRIRNSFFARCRVPMLLASLAAPRIGECIVTLPVRIDEILMLRDAEAQKLS